MELEKVMEGSGGKGMGMGGESRGMALFPCSSFIFPIFSASSPVSPFPSFLSLPTTPLPSLLYSPLSRVSTPLTPCLGLICSDPLIIHLGLEVRFGNLLFTVLWRRPGAQKRQGKGKENTAGKRLKLWCHCAY